MAYAANGSGVGWRTIGKGLAAGLVATLPMTVSMLAMHRRLKFRNRYPLPPRIITTRLLGGSGGSAATIDEVDDSELTALTLISHFAYGGACGALYAVGEKFLPGPRVATGVVFGLAVWAGSYLVWLPATGILAPATEHPRERVALMVAAHVVWGASTGLVFELLDRLAPTDGTGWPVEPRA
jgi:uncharacterized membrane protein YagU involved in acid resistance